MSKKVDRVFRIRQWRYDHIFKKWSENRKGNRLFYEDQKLFDKKMKQLCRICDRFNDELNLKMAITGEEFLDSSWVTFTFYPSNFDHQDVE